MIDCQVRTVHIGNMHRLQKTILQKLIMSPKVRYAQLKPRDIEGNLFMYHLRKLMKMGWVTKRDDGYYELTRTGKVYVDTLSLKTFAPRVQPRIVTLIALKNDQNQYLILKRKRQPLINQAGFVYGKIHLGEKIAEAALRELREKTGLTATLTHCGDGYVTIHEGGEAVSEIFFHLFCGENPSGELTVDTPTGTLFWANRKDFNTPPYMKSMVDLTKLIESSRQERFFVELSYDG